MNETFGRKNFRIGATGFEKFCFAPTPPPKGAAGGGGSPLSEGVSFALTKERLELSEPPPRTIPIGQKRLPGMGIVEGGVVTATFVHLLRPTPSYSPFLFPFSSICSSYYPGAPGDTLQKLCPDLPKMPSASSLAFDLLTVFMNFGSEASCAPS